MPIYRSKYDPYDIDRKQPFDTVEEGDVRVRIWRNEHWKQGFIWRFDVVHVTPRAHTDELSRGIPLGEAGNAVVCLQKFGQWVLEHHHGQTPRKTLSEVDLALLRKPDQRRR